MVISAKKFFSLFSPKMLLSSKKLLDEKIFKTSFPIKKGYDAPFPSKENWPQRRFFAIFSENTAFFFWGGGTLNNKILSTPFMIKKGMLVFGARGLLSLKNRQNVRPRQFFIVFSENSAFSKNC